MSKERAARRSGRRGEKIKLTRFGIDHLFTPTEN
jgi:hypothetical protein